MHRIRVFVGEVSADTSSFRQDGNFCLFAGLTVGRNSRNVWAKAQTQTTAHVAGLDYHQRAPPSDTSRDLLTIY